MSQSMSESPGDAAGLQVVILDTDALLWGLRAKLGDDALVDLNKVVRCLVVYCNTFALMHRLNRVCVVSQNDLNVRVLYPRRSTCYSDTFCPISDFNEVVTSEVLKEYVDNISISMKTGVVNRKSTATLSQALSKALCSKMRLIFSCSSNI